LPERCSGDERHGDPIVQRVAAMIATFDQSKTSAEVPARFNTSRIASTI
jgi:hypothetical protein